MDQSNTRGTIMDKKIPGRNPPEPVEVDGATCYLASSEGNVETYGKWCAIRERKGAWVRTYCGATVKFDVQGWLEGNATCLLCRSAMRQIEKDNNAVERRLERHRRRRCQRETMLTWSTNG